MPTLTLTAAFVQSVKPPTSGIEEYWDSAMPGLCLRVMATGRRSWTFRYRPKEGVGYKRLTLGSADDLSLAKARQRAQLRRIDVSDGLDPQADRRRRKAEAEAALTFDRLAERYIEEYAKPNKGSWRNDEGYLNRPRAKWKSRDPNTITRRDVIDLLDGIKSTAPVSANRTHSVIVTLFNWATEAELVTGNPAAGLKKRSKEKAKERTLSDDEVRFLWRALENPKEVTVDVAAALRFMLATGQRPGEVAGAMVSELIDVARPADARWEVPSERMKDGKPHVVPLSALALSVLTPALERRKEDGDGAVFASKFASRNTLARHSLSQGLGRLIERLDASGPSEELIRALKEHPPTPHDFRRTVATGMSRLGISREDRLAVLAHSQGDVHGVHYDRYERYREKRIALEAWSRHVTGLLGEKTTGAQIVPISKRKARAAS